MRRHLSLEELHRLAWSWAVCQGEAADEDPEEWYCEAISRVQDIDGCLFALGAAALSGRRIWGWGADLVETVAGELWGASGVELVRAHALLWEGVEE